MKNFVNIFHFLILNSKYNRHSNQKDKNHLIYFYINNLFVNFNKFSFIFIYYTKILKLYFFNKNLNT